MKNKILILVPDLNGPGGVSNYCRVLRKYFSKDIEYFIRKVSGYPPNKSFLSKCIDQFSNISRYLFRLLKGDIKHVHINVSFSISSLIRELYYLSVAKLFNKKVTIFFHGWDKNEVNKVQKKYKKVFSIIINKTECAFVLASDFKQDLIKLGYDKPVYIETTMYENELSEKTDKSMIEKKYDNLKNLELLYLSRIVKEKGVYEIIDTLNILNRKEKEYKFKLNIAGSGSELDNLKNYAKQNYIPDINFTGYIKGREKIDIFKKSHIFFFPTTYGEGLPISLIEAMAMGLPVITRPVGGIKDFFENEKMGYITESKDPKVFAELISKLVFDKNKMKEIALYNYNYAKKKFMASKVAKRLENTLHKICE